MAKSKDILAGRRILVGVTGGIAAYKAAMLVSTLSQRGAEVQVVMTASAQKFVTPLTFQSLTRSAVHTDMWEATEQFRSAHIALADWAEAAVVAPATANLLAKVACGLADDLLSTTLLAVDVPVLLAPAMNERMWNKQATQNNAALLAEWNYRLVGPCPGWLACGTRGEGRMSEPADIVAALEQMLADADAGRAPPSGRAVKSPSKATPKRGRMA